MGNKFTIGDRVLRVLTGTAHVIEDVSHNPKLEQMCPMTGAFSDASSPWNYMIDGMEVWIVEAALIPLPDDHVDPNQATTRKEDEIRA